MLCFCGEDSRLRPLVGEDIAHQLVRYFCYCCGKTPDQKELKEGRKEGFAWANTAERAEKTWWQRGSGLSVSSVRK